MLSHPPTVQFKFELSVQAIINLSKSSEDDAPPPPPPIVSPILGAPPPSYTLLSPLCTPALKSLPASASKQSQCIVQSLRKLIQMLGRKNILKRLDYDKIKAMEVEFLPPTYDSDVLFVLLAVSIFASHSKAKSLFGMDKQYDGHIWTKIVIINIRNILDLSFQSSSCIGHLCCENPHCEYLHRVH